MFVLFIDKRAARGIYNVLDYYNSIRSGLGKKFETALEKEFLTLQSNPYYQIKYKNVRCKLVKKFSYLIHYTPNSRRKKYLYLVLFVQKEILKLVGDKFAFAITLQIN